MSKYILKRILIIIPILLGVSFIVFSILSLTPGDPARLMLGVGATDEALNSLREELGLNRPFLTRYVDYMLGIFHGDFGVSYRTKLPVFDEISVRFPVTLRLAVLSIAVVTVFGILLGVLSAVRQHKLTDYILSVFAMLAASIPGFWLGLMMTLLFALQLKWLPSFGLDSWKSYVMPVIALSLPSMAELMRMTRSTMLETIRQDYVRTARSKGLSERVVILGHALKNALMPIITVIGSNFGGLLGGAVVIETVFSLPGIGNMIVTSIRTKDVPQVMAGTMFIALMFCIVLLVVDVAYALIDPRIRTRYESSKKKTKEARQS